MYVCECVYVFVFVVCVCVCLFIDRCMYRYEVGDYNNNNVSRKEFWSVVGGGGMLRQHCYIPSVRRITRKILIVLYYIIIYFAIFFLFITLYYSTLYGTLDDSPIRAFVSRTGQIVPYREKKIIDHSVLDLSPTETRRTTAIREMIIILYYIEVTSHCTWISVSSHRRYI